MKTRYSCLIVDDEPLARKLMANYIEKTPQLDLKGSFKSAMEVIEFLHGEKVDLIFLDIRMPGLSGIGLLEKEVNIPAVILTTAYEEYAVKAFELDVIDYLVKPFPLERFLKAVTRFEEYAETRLGAEKDGKHLMVKMNHGFTRIPHDEILYIEASGEYMQPILTSGPTEMIYMRMKELEVLLGKDFIRIHKSFLVNTKKIDKYSANHLMIGDVQLKISRLYKPGFLKRMDAEL